MSNREKDKKAFDRQLKFKMTSDENINNSCIFDSINIYITNIVNIVIQLSNIKL